MITDFWLTKYFPSLIADVNSTFLPIAKLSSEIESVMGKTVNIDLDNNIRSGISAFCKLSEQELKQGILKLSEDMG